MKLESTIETEAVVLPSKSDSQRAHSTWYASPQAPEIVKSA
jgi:hypothetical protein